VDSISSMMTTSNDWSTSAAAPLTTSSMSNTPLHAATHINSHASMTSAPTPSPSTVASSIAFDNNNNIGTHNHSSNHNRRSSGGRLVLQPLTNVPSSINGVNVNGGASPRRSSIPVLAHHNSSMIAMTSGTLTNGNVNGGGMPASQSFDDGSSSMAPSTPRTLANRPLTFALRSPSPILA
jgi:hypothetical protein